MFCVSSVCEVLSVVSSGDRKGINDRWLDTRSMLITAFQF